jgi:leucyl aminopeptidase (aminopeptidase T)
LEFNLEKFFVEVFAPGKDEVVTIMIDIPKEEKDDNNEWKERRKMADEWRHELNNFSGKYSLTVNPLVKYYSTNNNNTDLPEKCFWETEKKELREVIENSTIIISMTEFSATAPLYRHTLTIPKLRVGSMPGVLKSMEETALSADHKKIAETCRTLKPLFDQAVGIEVTFSTGHKCYYDISNNNIVYEDDGVLHPAEEDEKVVRLRNLPTGEVCTCPNELSNSKTSGEIPVTISGELIVFKVEKNKIVDIIGKGKVAENYRLKFNNEKALCNIAEVAIGCNDKAVVTGNVLEDEKAGFHWAYGLSDHMGGTISVKDFSSPDKIEHIDIVYAKGNPIVCAKLDFVFKDGSRKTVIKNGELIL